MRCKMTIRHLQFVFWHHVIDFYPFESWLSWGYDAEWNSWVVGPFEVWL